MTAWDTTTNKTYDSKFAARIARKIGVTDDTIWRWCAEGYKMKQHGNYIVFLDSETLQK